MNAGRTDAAASPCIGICRMEESLGVCEGCWRTLGEIAEWGGAGDHRRHEILRVVAARRQAAARPEPDDEERS